MYLEALLSQTKTKYFRVLQNVSEDITLFFSGIRITFPLFFCLIHVSNSAESRNYYGRVHVKMICGYKHSCWKNNHGTAIVTVLVVGLSL